jgi:hypothetical protein
MSVLPISHFEWQSLRTAKRSRKPLTGRALRIVPTRHTKDGTFLTDLVQRGLLTRVAGREAEPFEATYALTPLGEYAAEYGACEKVCPPNATVGEVAAPKVKKKVGRPRNRE